MSNKHINYVMESSPFKGAARMVHVVLADHANADDECWLKQESIAKEAGCSIRYVKKVIKQMVELGLLEIAKRRHQGGGNYNQYVLRTEQKGTVVPLQKGTTDHFQKGTVVPLPIGTPIEPTLEPPSKTPAPTAREEEPMPQYGEIPGDPDAPPPPEKKRYWRGKQGWDDQNNPFDEPTRIPHGPPKRAQINPGTYAWCLKYFRETSYRLGHHEFNVGITRKMITEMRSKHHYSYPEIEKIFRRFFIGHEAEVRAYQGNVSVMFRHMLPQLMKETAGTIQTQRRAKEKPKFQQEAEEFWANYGKDFKENESA